MVRGARRPSAALVRLDLPGAVARGRSRFLSLRASPLGRRAARRRVVALVLAGATGLLVAHRLEAAGQTLAQWGPTEAVLVAAVPLGAGTPLDAATVRTEQWPSRLVPAGALRTTDDRRTARSVAAGAPLTADDVARPGTGPVAARLPAGTVGVTVPRGAAPAPVRTGDRVDVLGSTAEGRTLGARRVAAGAVVVAVDRVTVTVAVRRTEADDVAAAAAAGTAVLVLVP